MIHDPAEKSYAAALARGVSARSIAATEQQRMASLRMVVRLSSVRVSRVRRAVAGLEAVVGGQPAAVGDDLREGARGAVRLERNRVAGRGEDDGEIVVAVEVAVAVDVVGHDDVDVGGAVAVDVERDAAV